MIREEAQQYKARYQLMNQFTQQENRTRSPEERLRQLAVMFAASRTLGWEQPLKEGVEAIRSRWMKLLNLHVK
jgi:hypothetical protein